MGKSMGLEPVDPIPAAVREAGALGGTLASRPPHRGTP